MKQLICFKHAQIVSEGRLMKQFPKGLSHWNIRKEVLEETEKSELINISNYEKSQTICCKIEINGGKESESDT